MKSKIVLGGKIIAFTLSLVLFSCNKSKKGAIADYSIWINNGVINFYEEGLHKDSINLNAIDSHIKDNLVSCHSPFLIQRDPLKIGYVESNDEEKKFVIIENNTKVKSIKIDSKLFNFCLLNKRDLFATDGINMFLININNQKVTEVIGKENHFQQSYQNYSFIPTNGIDKIVYSIPNNIFLLSTNTFQTETIANCSKCKSANFSPNGDEIIYIDDDTIYVYNISDNRNSKIYSLDSTKTLISALFYNSSDKIYIEYGNNSTEKLSARSWNKVIDRKTGKTILKKESGYTANSVSMGYTK